MNYRSWKVAISPKREVRDDTTPDQVALDMMTIEFTVSDLIKQTPAQIVEDTIRDLHLTGKVDYTLVPADRCFEMPCPHRHCEYKGLPTSVAVHYTKEHTK